MNFFSTVSRLVKCFVTFIWLGNEGSFAADLNKFKDIDMTGLCSCAPNRSSLRRPWIKTTVKNRCRRTKKVSRRSAKHRGVSKEL